MRGLFVTATDTGAGKTMVAAAIARQWRREGRPFRICKPVATGATVQQGRLVNEDTIALAQAAEDSEWEAITPYTFAVPAAPPVAAAFAKQELTLEMLVEAVQRRPPAGAAVLVEGVGGLLCPLTGVATIADLIERLALPVVVVARRSLGTLNHTLLTLEVARRRGLNVVGVVVNETTPVNGLAEETNVEELRRRIELPILAVVPHQTAMNREIPAISAVNWWSIIE